MLSVSFDGVVKQWPDQPPALDHLDLTIAAGEFVSLVGPSGCGKSTALRVLAGLDEPSAGRVLHGGDDITDLPSCDRHFGFVTQDEQLLKHLTARRNIGFPLELRAATVGGSIEARVRDEAHGFGITALLDRAPRTLSHGQRRLVQLARAVISSPSTLLLDEPLGYLEERARVRVRSEILRIHRQRSLTSVMATASQTDAMSMSDRVAVMFHGLVDQYAPPGEVYARPATARVARFFGDPGMNLVAASTEVAGSHRRIRFPGAMIETRIPAPAVAAGRDVLVGIRAQDVEIGAPRSTGIVGRVRAVEPLGPSSVIFVRAECGVDLTCHARGGAPAIGTVLDLGFPPDRLHVFDASTGLALHHPDA